MNVAFLTGTFSSFSGIERQVQYQAEALVKKGHQVAIYTFAADMKPTANYELHVLGLPKNSFVERVYRLLYPLFPWIIQRQVKYLAGYDEVICHQYPLTALAAMAKKRYRSKYTYFDHGVPPPSIFPSPVDRFYIWVFRKLMVPTIRSADRIVCISRYLQQEMKVLTGIEAEVQYDEYDHHRFHPNVDDKSIRQQYNLGDRPIILFIGRISPHKNIQELIQAFHRIDAKYWATLIIVGKKTFNKYGANLEAGAGPNVIFAGYVPDEEIPSYYGAADVYATASLWEGYDLPVVEARACGKPTVMYDIGPHPEIAVPSDSLVSARDISVFARALERQIEKRSGLISKIEHS